jgi:hypothetical protein
MPDDPNIEAVSIDPSVVDLVRSLSKKAQQNKETGKQLGLGMISEEEIEREDIDGAQILKDIQDPPEAYDLYYGVRRELMNKLPRGEDFKKLRYFIYEEKNLYLRQGKPHVPGQPIGADSRQAYLTHLRNALVVVRKWTASAGDPAEIFQAFLDLNIKAGYRKFDSDQQSGSTPPSAT